MPKKRLTRELWEDLRFKVWNRDNHRCVNCHCFVDINNCHIDHIQSGVQGNNKSNNLRTLCIKCHTLRSDKNHRGMIAIALKKGIIPPNWREYVWYDD